MGTNMAIWEHRIFLPFLFIFIFVLSLNCLSTKGVVVKNIYILYYAATATSSSSSSFLLMASEDASPSSG